MTDTTQALSLDDREAIRELPVRYSNAIDRGDWDAVRGIVHEKARFLAGGDQFDGVEAIIDMTAAALKGLDSSQHFITNVVVDALPADDRVEAGELVAATVRSYLQAQHVKEGVEGGSTFLVGGVFTDRVERSGQGWQFVERSLDVLWAEGNPAVHP